jgi:hypothetical protein
MNEKMLKELHECEWKVKCDGCISLVMGEKYIHDKIHEQVKMEWNTK